MLRVGISISILFSKEIFLEFITWVDYLRSKCCRLIMNCKNLRPVPLTVSFTHSIEDHAFVEILAYRLVINSSLSLLWDWKKSFLQIPIDKHWHSWEHYVEEVFLWEECLTELTKSYRVFWLIGSVFKLLFVKKVRWYSIPQLLMGA